MKKGAFFILFTLIAFFANAQAIPQQSENVNNKTIEIACGECKFNMKGKSCNLAVRIEVKTYFVDGKHIDDFGDAHDEKYGFCNVISIAKVSGKIVNGRFKAKKIELVPLKINQ